MHRRDFITSVGALTLAAGASEMAFSKERSFDPTEQSIAALQAAMTAGTTSAEALTAAYLDRIARFDHFGPELRSVLSLNPNALADARSLDQQRKAGKLRGALHGIPILIKDNIEVAGLPTTAGSLALARSVRPDAPLAARLRANGALVLGKANLSEWANFRSTRSCSGWSGVGGQVRNAYDRNRNPSGSQCRFGGFCRGEFLRRRHRHGDQWVDPLVFVVEWSGRLQTHGGYGFRQGRGARLAQTGHRGPMCRTVADAALIANIIVEHPLGYGAHGSSLEAFRLKGVRIGVPPLPQGVHPGTAGLFADARAVLEGEGALLVDLQLPGSFGEIDAFSLDALLYEFKAAINDYLAVLDAAQVQPRTLADLIAFNEAYKDQELVIFGQEIFEKAQECGPLSDDKYVKGRAGLDRAVDQEGLAKMLEGVELLLSPSNGPAELIDPVWGDRRGGGWSQIANAAAIAGYPSITVPAGLVNGLPVGITLVTKRNQDGLLLQTARAYERAANARMPPHLAV